MRSFTQLIILAVASLAKVSAVTAPVEDYVECKACLSPDCFITQFDTQVNLIEEKKYGQMVRTFHTPNKGNNSPQYDLIATFSYEGSLRTSPPPSGLITSTSGEAAIIQIDLEASKSAHMAFKIEPDSTCSLTFPDQFYPRDITKVKASMDKKMKSGFYPRDITMDKKKKKSG